MWNEPNKTYKDDILLFKELKLEPFDIPTWEKHFVGEVDKDSYKVKVWVTCAPAKFWEFEIYNKSAGKVTYKLSTGSGALKDYWKSIEMFAEGMLTLKMINEVII